MKRRSQREAGEPPTLTWDGVIQEQLDEDLWAITLQTDRGDVEARYHPAHSDETSPGHPGGVVWVGGAGGGLDGPARGLYPEACSRLQRLAVAGLRLHYRHPNHLEECVLDTLLGAEFLAQQGCGPLALVGHSFGGAVVITAGALSDQVQAVVPMSTQTYGSGLAAQVAPRAMLLVHGTNDQVLPDTCSRQVYERAKQPKELQLYAGAGHGLDEVREELLNLLVHWLSKHLRADASIARPSAANP